MRLRSRALLDPGTPHPLLIPLVTREVLSYLPSKDLLNCRMVCTLWEELCDPEIKKKQPTMYIRDEETVDSMVGIGPSNINPNFNSFQIGQNFSIGNDKLFQMLVGIGENVTYLDLSKTYWFKYSKLRGFLASTMPNLVTLHLQIVEPQQEFSTLLLKFPNWDFTSNSQQYILSNLKHMFLTIDYTVEMKDGFSLPLIKQSMAHLLRGMPNLEDIHCNAPPITFAEQVRYNIMPSSIIYPFLQPIFQALGSAFVSLPKLRVIDVPMKCWINFDDLERQSYPLETLNWLIRWDLTEETVEMYLNSIARTLKTLTLDYTYDTNLSAGLSFDINYAHRDVKQFLHLESLHLRSFHASLSVIFPIPNLKSLKISKARRLQSLFDEDSFTTKRYPALEKLVIDQYDPAHAISVEVLQQIGITFSSLKTLEVQFLTDEAIRTIFSFMPVLEELIARDGCYTDAGITGISIHKLDKAARSLDGIPVRSTARYRDPTVPYIANLRTLKKLDLRSKYLSDMAVYFGLLDCENLEDLTLMAYGFTNRSLTTIAERFQLNSFTTIFCAQLTEEGAEHIKERLPNCKLSLNELQKPLDRYEIFCLGLLQGSSGKLRTVVRPPPPAYPLFS